MAKLFMWVSFSVMLAAFIVTELYRGVWESVFVLTVALSSFVMIGLINWAYRQIMAEDVRINQQLLKTVKEQLEIANRYESDRVLTRELERENLNMTNELYKNAVEELRHAKAREALEALSKKEHAEAMREYDKAMGNRSKNFSDHGEL